MSISLSSYCQVSTRRRFDVVTTLFGRQQRCYNVQTMSCAYLVNAKPILTTNLMSWVYEQARILFSRWWQAHYTTIFAIFDRLNVNVPRIRTISIRATIIHRIIVWELGEFSKVQKFQSLARMLTIHLSVNSDKFYCTMPSD